MGLRKKDFEFEKGRFNGFTLEKVFLWKNDKGNYTGCISLNPYCLEGQWNSHQSFRIDNSNVFVNYKSDKDYIVADIVLTGDNSRNGEFTTFFAKVSKEYKYTSVVKDSEYRGTEDYNVLDGEHKVTSYMVRGEKLGDALFWASRNQPFGGKNKEKKLSSDELFDIFNR